MRLVCQQNVLQYVLQRLQILVANVDQTGEVIVPVPDKVVQANNRDNRRRQRQHDLVEIPEVRQSIDLRRIMKFFGDRGLEEGAGNDHIEYAEGPRNDENPDAVQQSQLFHQQVAGDQAATEEHCEGKEEQDHAARLEFFTGQGEGRWKRDDQVHCCAQERVQQGVTVTNPDTRIFQDLQVALEINTLGENRDFTCRYQVRV